MPQISVNAFLLRQLKTYPSYILLFFAITASKIVEKIYLPFLISLFIKEGYVFSIIRDIIVFYCLNECVFCRLWHYMVDVHIGPKIQKSTIDDAMQHLIKTKYQYHEENTAPELAAKVEELSESTNCIEIILTYLLAEPITMFVALFTLYQKNAFVFALTTLWCVNFITSLIISSLYTEKMSHDCAIISTKNTSNRAESLTNIWTIKIFSNPNKEMRNIKEDTVKESNLQKRFQIATFISWQWIWTSFEVLRLLVISISLREGLHMHDIIYIMQILNQINTSAAYFGFYVPKLIKLKMRVKNGLTIYEAPTE